MTRLPRGEAAAARCVCFAAICGADGWSPGQRAAGPSLHVTRMMCAGSLRALVNTFLCYRLVKGLGKTLPFFPFFFFPSPSTKEQHSPFFLSLIPLFFSSSSLLASLCLGWTSAALQLISELAGRFFQRSNDSSQVLRRRVIVCANWSIDQHMELLSSFFLKQVWGIFFQLIELIKHLTALHPDLQHYIQWSITSRIEIREVIY